VEGLLWWSSDANPMRGRPTTTAPSTAGPLNDHHSRRASPSAATSALLSPRACCRGRRGVALLLAAVALLALLSVLVPLAATTLLWTTPYYFQIWLHRALVRRGLVSLNYASQNGQDIYVHQRFFGGRQRRRSRAGTAGNGGTGGTDGAGVFVEFGASDGLSNSNSYFFETQLGWKGLCVEPVIENFNQLTRSRPNCVAIHGVVLDKCPAAGKPAVPGGAAPQSMVSLTIPPFMGTAGLTSTFRESAAGAGKRLARLQAGTEVRRVPCHVLSDLLTRTGIRRVDYMSIDTEGSELQIIRGFPWDQFEVDVVQVEAIVRSAEEIAVRDAIIVAMKRAGYVLDQVLDVVREQYTTDLVFRKLGTYYYGAGGGGGAGGALRGGR